MNWQTVYAWSKKIHKLVMWIAIIMGAGMSAGGLLLHKEVEGEAVPSIIDMVLVRRLHNQISQPFVMVLGIMMATGFLMWGVPKIIARNVKHKQGEK